MECNKASITTRIEQLLAAESALLEQRDHALLNQTATAGTGSSSSSNRHCRRSSCSCSSCSSCCFNPTMLAWRGKVAQWFFDVADHFHERRSVVYVAMNILDRYCCSCYWTQQQEHKKKQANSSSVPAAVFMDAKKYELASMAALFIAFRMAKPSSGSSAAATKIRLSHLTSMSRGGRIQVRHVIGMGADIIHSLASSLEHRVIPPLEFVTLYLQEEAPFLPPPLPPPAAAAAASAASSSTAVPGGSSNDKTILRLSSSSGILELATYLVEISIFDIVLSRCKASDIALAATLEAIDKQHGARSSALESSLSALFLKKISTTRSSEETIASIRSRLQLLYRRSADHASAGRSPTRRRRRRHSSSRHQNAAAAAAACENNLVTEDERDDDDDEEEDHDDDASISPRRQQQAIRSVPDDEEEQPSVILREQQLSSTGAWGRKRRRRVY